jgi:NADH:ubiquinone oxidoreductase subunit 4 (subunit M)
LFYGAVGSSLRGFADFNKTEFTLGTILLLAMLGLGVKPGIVLEFFEPKFVQALI